MKPIKELLQQRLAPEQWHLDVGVGPQYCSNIFEAISFDDELRLKSELDGRCILSSPGLLGNVVES